MSDAGGVPCVMAFAVKGFPFSLASAYVRSRRVIEIRKCQRCIEKIELHYFTPVLNPGGGGWQYHR